MTQEHKLSRYLHYSKAKHILSTMVVTCGMLFLLKYSHIYSLFENWVKYIWKLSFLKTLSLLGEDRDISINCDDIRKQLLSHLDVCFSNYEVDYWFNGSLHASHQCCYNQLNANTHMHLSNLHGILKSYKRNHKSLLWGFLVVFFSSG